MGCAETEEGNPKEKKEVARGGWAEAAKRLPATALVPGFRERFI
jgi:hypothetical protein